MHLYLYQFPTNEILLATLASATVYCVLRILCVPSAGARDYLTLGLALGASLLAKVSAVLLIPPVGVVLLAKLFLDRRRQRWQQAAFRVILLGAVALGVCGWHYLRVWAHFGRPVVTNADPDIGRPSWQDPGYHTSAAFCRFGECFRSPLVQRLLQCGRWPVRHLLVRQSLRRRPVAKLPSAVVL